MELNRAKLGAAITFEDEIGKYIFSEGDSVVCIADGNKHEGIITCVGTYKDYKEEFAALILDTSKGKLSHSTEIIKIDDVTYMFKNPMINTKDEERPIALIGEEETILQDIKMKMGKSLGTFIVGSLLFVTALATFVND